MRGLLVAAMLFATGMATNAHALIIAGPTVNGLATFADTSTGLTWLKLNDFFNKSSQQMVATATTAGFTWSDVTHVGGLLADLPLGNNQWSSYAATIGSAPNRLLYWASYAPVVNGLDGYSYAFSTSSAWTGCPNCDSYTSVTNANSSNADMNIFAYRTSAPEPGSLAVLSTGLAALCMFRHRKAWPSSRAMRRRSEPSPPAVA